LKLLDHTEIARAASVGMEVAASAVDPERLEAGVAALHAQTGFSVVRWLPVSLALGDAGAAVVCAVLDDRSPEAGWDRAGQRFLRNAAAGLSDPSVPLSLFTGVGGVAAAAWLLSRGGRRYRGLRDALDAQLLPSIVPREHQYDLIHGISGYVAYLLLGAGGPDRESILRATTTTLATTNHLRSTESGLAHGLAGPLAALALARHRSGIRLQQVDVAIRQLAGRLADAVATTGQTGTTWCGEAPGIARALWLAGAAVDDNSYRRAGVDLALASFRRPVADRGYRTPTLCHGLAGHLLVAALFWWDTKEPVFRAKARELCDHLLDWHEPGTVFGFRDQERSGRRVDNPGLLCGAAGVALVLLALAADQPPAWCRLFLLN
jgi:lantibiotic biosynthesis protein